MQVGLSLRIAGLGLVLAGIAGCAGTYDGPYNGNTSTSTDDAAITAQIESRLAGDRDLNLADSRVDITTKDGRVQLSGNVPSARDRQEAEEVARSVPGVRRVDSDIKIG